MIAPPEPSETELGVTLVICGRSYGDAIRSPLHCPGTVHPLGVDVIRSTAPSIGPGDDRPAGAVRDELRSILTIYGRGYGDAI